MRIGFAGLGRMGLAIAERLLSSGYKLTVWNRTRQKAEPLMELGAKWAVSPKELTEFSDIIISIVSDDNAVNEVYLGQEGLLQTNYVGKIFLEMSTIKQQTIHFLEERIVQNGGIFLDSPVSGTVVHVQEGNLIAIIGGDEESIQTVTPILKTFCKSIKNIPRAIRNVLIRIIVFYLASIIILSAIFPTEELGLLESPFVTLMGLAGIPFAPDIMNFVILTAILSVGNSCIYASTRLLWAMAHEGMAPKRLGKLSKRKVPFTALVFTMIFSLLSLLTSFIAADTVFVLLMSVAGISVTISWIGIALSQLMFRRKYLRGGGKLEDLQYKVPFYPFIPIVCIVSCVSILIFLAFDPTQLIGLLIGLGFLVICYLFYYFKNKQTKANSETHIKG
jgi:hypothetical protein